MNKAQIRRQIKSKRLALTNIYQQQAAKNLKYNLLQIKRIIYAKKIAVYLAANGEISLSPFINWCLLNHKKVYAPIISRYPKHHMRFVRLFNLQNLKYGKYKILEPKNTKQTANIINLDVVLMPLVAFDKNGTRLGMGKGFYDRFLAKAQYKFKPYRIGIGYDFQHLPNIAHNNLDVPLNCAVTDYKIYYF